MRRALIPLVVALSHLAASATLYHANVMSGLTFLLVAPGFLAIELFAGGQDAFRHEYGTLIREAALFGISAGFYGFAVALLMSRSRRHRIAVAVAGMLVLGLAALGAYIGMLDAVGGP